jgi:acetylornithine/N-succinyldiaminopimelate aminotransferase
MIPPVMPTYATRAASFERGEGCWLIDDRRATLLDFGAGIAVNALGHAHPALVAALTEQAGKLWHTSNLYRIPAAGTAGARLVDATFADTVFFTNSGTEAMPSSPSRWRANTGPTGSRATGRSPSFGRFHGRSTAAIAGRHGQADHGLRAADAGLRPNCPLAIMRRWKRRP